MPHGPVIVVFGITGDLSKRKLLPALYHLLRQGELPEDTKVVGLSRRPLSAEDLLSTVELCVLEQDKVCDPVGLARVRASLQTHQLDPENAADYQSLKKLLDSYDGNGHRERLFYMSVPAAAYAPIIQHFAAVGLNGPQSRLLLEKPFGYDVASAQELVNLVNQDFQESQIYRIDHYLAKETAQNLLAFRMHNPIFSPLWSASHIQRVHITANETIGIEGRVAFYEQTGALRDLIQSHLMQLLSITLMDLPSDMSSEAIHLSKQHFMEQLKPADLRKATRGQYSGYRDEVNNPHSTIETYARIHLEHSAERWQGTDIILETGKGLAEKTTEITIEFKNPHERRRNNLTFHIQPNEGIGLDLVVKEPGFANHMHHTSLDFRYADTFKDMPHVDAYERVLMDAVRGDQSLFASDREVLATWEVLQPILDAWQGSETDLKPYELGSDGPS
ncbi:MAG: zwf, glucose-6-phosphate 1-dehydrogenase [Candidatus Saccharibacteria bacterium]|nr:zwf, glucose-6-phosphate 1-dehydrogenase [Candidatus Saccharibacteria bacterium]